MSEFRVERGHYTTRAMATDLVVVDEADGLLEAEILRGLLEANGIAVWLSGESAGAALGLGVGPMATIEILVVAEVAEQAQRILSENQPSDD